MNWSELSDVQMLTAYAELMEELRSRGICRSSNNPVGDYTEGLVAAKLHLELRGKSASGYDAVDPAGKRYQIKGRRLTPHNQSTQLSALRNMKDEPFDFLVAVIYNPNFTVAYAGIVPYSVVLENSVGAARWPGPTSRTRRSPKLRASFVTSIGIPPSIP
jgi:hypothetical protein